MTNEEVTGRIRALAGEIIALTDRVSAPREPLVEEAPKAEPAKPVKLEEVRAALTDLTSAKGAATTKQLLAEYGAAKLSDIPADKFASLLADAKAWADE